MCIGNLWTAPYDCIANLRDGGVVGEPGGVAAGAGALVGARGAALVRDLGDTCTMIHGATVTTVCLYPLLHPTGQ